jgi:hypothetical protein
MFQCGLAIGRTTGIDQFRLAGDPEITNVPLPDTVTEPPAITALL